MNSGDNGGSCRSMYDQCAYNKKLRESVSPLSYMMYSGMWENCKPCCGQSARPRLAKVVDVESELRNQTRYYSRCPELKYNPTCNKVPNCTSTFDSRVPMVVAPEVCPIVFNNIPKLTDVGYRLDAQPYCGK